MPGAAAKTPTALWTSSWCVRVPEKLNEQHVTTGRVHTICVQRKVPPIRAPAPVLAQERKEQGERKRQHEAKVNQDELSRQRSKAALEAEFAVPWRRLLDRHFRYAGRCYGSCGGLCYINAPLNPSRCGVHLKLFNILAEMTARNITGRQKRQSKTSEYSALTLPVPDLQGVPVPFLCTHFC